jgi:hypothetical protein
MGVVINANSSREGAALACTLLHGTTFSRLQVERFALRVRELFPACPTGRERVIAEHACRKYSGRIGRSTAGKSLDEEAIRLAVTAHVRHTETRYDELLGKGYERREARERVEQEVLRVLAKWEGDPHSGA